MDDQFGGRTDDDLFYDDFEPVESETILVTEEHYPQQTPAHAPTSSTQPSVSVEPSRPRQQQQQQQQPKPKKSSPPVHKAPVATTSQPQPQPQPQVKGGNLSSSRYARKGNANSKQQQQQQQQQSTPPPPAAAHKSKAPNSTTNTTNATLQNKQSESKDEGDASPPANAPTAPAKETKSHSSQHAAAHPEARLGSGANPRQKLTEAELAAKMEQMKLISAEKARKFEMAEQDEKQHAQAYAKGMEDARKRRAEDAERRRRGEEEKRKLDDERAKNRERKLKAMGMKEGGWDEGKEAILEEEARKGFRGANGGIRGTKRGGLGGSRFAMNGGAHGQGQPDVDRFLDERHRERGHGRGDRGPGRGRQGRGAAFTDGGPSSNPKPMSAASAPALTTDEFPALPSDGSKKKSNTATVPVYPPPKAEYLPIPSLDATAPPAGSKWDDEMEALDELKKKEQS
ncbi:hypothetical protein E4U43_002160 [Claviceps pusilla]|uniref:Uncharacterized protein n=1 Tax=Claviceps pusilla TaxID=123648 RepID=A0A9P7N941_9HYPO|nr:hypothetical protein E4U43_002160 [Claviceps pusilla]